jgi:hypothetical protein
MNKLSKLISELDEEDLKLIQKDLEAGNLDKLISQKIREKTQADFNKVCPVCQAPTDEESITLIFGPKGLRKKASFCALDCLEYFINRIKKQKKIENEKIENQSIEGGINGEY